MRKGEQHELTIKYLDSSGDWIDLRDDDFDTFVDMIETATIVPERENILRITLKVSNIASPNTALTAAKRLHSPSPVKTSASFGSGVGKRVRGKLMLGEVKTVEGSSSSNDYVAPTQLFFQKLNTDKSDLQAKVRRMEQEISDLEESFLPNLSTSLKGPLCSNCHTGGHNKTNCYFAACVSATICHDIKRHADESRFLKGKKDELKTMKSKLTKVQDDIKSKEEVYNSLQNNFATKVQTDLINSDHDKYLRKTSTGQLVPNWLVVNADLRKLERVCKGTIPSKSDIPRLIKQYNEGFDVLKDSSEEKVHNVNPVKSLWEKKGIKFPRRL